LDFSGEKNNDWGGIDWRIWLQRKKKIYPKKNFWLRLSG
jgi:hypothetical protein